MCGVLPGGGGGGRGVDSRTGEPPSREPPAPRPPGSPRTSRSPCSPHPHAPPRVPASLNPPTPPCPRGAPDPLSPFCPPPAPHYPLTPYCPCPPATPSSSRTPPCHAPSPGVPVPAELRHCGSPPGSPRRPRPAHGASRRGRTAAVASLLRSAPLRSVPFRPRHGGPAPPRAARARPRAHRRHRHRRRRGGSVLGAARGHRPLPAAVRPQRAAPGGGEWAGGVRGWRGEDPEHRGEGGYRENRGEIPEVFRAPGGSTEGIRGSGGEHPWHRGMHREPGAPRGGTDSTGQRHPQAVGACSYRGWWSACTERRWGLGPPRQPPPGWGCPRRCTHSQVWVPPGVPLCFGSRGGGDGV